MPNAKKPLEPDDFPVNAEEKKIKKHDGHLSLTPTIRLSRPTSPSALTTTKLGAKKISGQLSIKRFVSLRSSVPRYRIRRRCDLALVDRRGRCQSY